LKQRNSVGQESWCLLSFQERDGNAAGWEEDAASRAGLENDKQLLDRAGRLPLISHFGAIKISQRKKRKYTAPNTISLKDI